MNPADISMQFVTEARSVARKMGVLRPIALLKAQVLEKLGRGSYEEAFDKALRDTIRANDVVWDVGANVGLYTKKFSEWVGPSGVVVGFEPIPDCFKQLTQAVVSCGNVQCHQFALGEKDESLMMNMSESALGATHSFSGHDQGTKQIPVEVKRGDSAREQLSLPSPNVIKIDVEGFEEEVLAGLENTLGLSSCRAVLIEVHFGILDSRGQRQAPQRICARLRALGFNLRWSDVSHLVATR